MKKFPIWLVMFCAVSAGWAQTNTNHYKPNGADMRIVDGKMYNRTLSTNWTTLPPAGATLEAVEVISEGVVVKNSAKDGKPAEKLLIKHYPDEKNVAKGQMITMPFRALAVGSIKYGSETVPVYDCGLANTKENRKTLVNGPIHATP
jgi:hypothetical protein